MKNSIVLLACAGLLALAGCTTTTQTTTTETTRRAAPSASMQSLDRSISPRLPARGEP